jgi:hypothetical protein
VQPGEHSLFLDVAENQGHLFVSAGTVQVADGLEITVHSGQRGIHDPLDTRGPGFPGENAIYFCHDSGS